jgi:hypothetical protein
MLFFPELKPIFSHILYEEGKKNGFRHFIPLKNMLEAKKQIRLSRGIAATVDLKFVATISQHQLGLKLCFFS